MSESKQNKHLEHLEDQIINLGAAGAKEAIQFLENLLKTFSGSAQASVNVTVKWDGAPAIVCGKDPETGYFFVGTKHAAFAKNSRLAFNLQDIDAIYAGKGTLVDTLKAAFIHLKDLPFTGVLQGDVMFTSAMKKNRTIDGREYITFRPNTILYAAPVDSDLGKKIDKAEFGVVFHTTYHGRTTVNEMSAEFGADVSKLRGKNPKAWIEDAFYKDLSGTASLTAAESAKVKKGLDQAKVLSKKCGTFLNELAKGDTDLSPGYLFKIFVNSLVRTGKLNKKEILSGFGPYVIERIEKKEASVKTATAKERYTGIKKETEAYLRKNDANLRAMVDLFDILITLKNIFVKKLNKIQGISTFIETDSGYKVTAPEGYVAIDKKGNAVKLVDRLEFSMANFNAVKDWGDPKPAKEEKLRTIVFAYGRMNPPTIGHGQLVKTVMDMAAKEGGDHLIIISHTQDKKKNPLPQEVKLKFARKFWPQANFAGSDSTRPTIIQFLKSFSGKYDKVIMVAGSDRVPEYRTLIDKYNGTEFTFKIVDVVSAGERDPDADGTTGISASKMREFAVNSEFDSFKKGLPSKVSRADALELLMTVRQGLGL
jgi:hypothetical protein